MGLTTSLGPGGRASRLVCGFGVGQLWGLEGLLVAGLSPLLSPKKYEDQLISPKQFVHLSGKATLKDWKRAIRMGGVMLRKMMDSGQLDFYQHSTLCTNTCRSTKFDLLINNTRFPPDSTGLTTPTSSQVQAVLGNGGSLSEERSDVLNRKLDWSSMDSAEKKGSSEISEDTLNFWKGIADVGLLGEVVTNINTELVQMLDGVLQRREQAVLQDTDSCLVEVAVLSNLAQVFGLLDLVKKVLEKRKQQTDPSQEQILSILSSNCRLSPAVQAVLGNGGSLSEERSDVLNRKLDWSSMDSAEKKGSSEISEDTLNFWKGIADVGLLGEVVTNINTELVQMLDGVLQRREQAVLQDTEVAVLSNLAQVFGLLDLVKKVLEKRKQQTDPSQEQILSILSNLEAQLEEQKKQQQVRALLSSPQTAKNKPATKRPTKRPRLQRPASTTTLLTSPVSQQAALQPQQFTVLSPISLSSVGQPFTVAGLPIASLAQSSSTVTLLPAGSQIFTRYMVAGDGKSDAITLHPSSGLTLVGTTAVQDSSQLGTVVSPVELLHLSQHAAGAEMVPIEGQVVDGTMLVQQEVLQGELESNQEHTVIEINPSPVEQTVGMMELQLAEEPGRDATAMVVQSGIEVTMATEDSQCQMQEAQTEGVQGLQLDANGQLSGVQIVVIEENTQEEKKAE
ncbi:PREDICTED: glucocorticoid modulatory element-binding protein 1-like [Cyprinodon variegatus]|uniref:glucocorticoid modulatory element-binding protein 1-like n=1 Tax=Cyprinodon variegatus TaxID=28743 RepID=UPI00074266C0|nr:PREDICTED: glucocorticoid modulatory element-binding protein 1-like [Cyprinodon variegatus]